MKKKLLVLVMALASVVAVTGCEKKEEKKDEGTTTTTTQAAAPTKLDCTLTEGKDSVRKTYYLTDGSITKISYRESREQKDEKTAKSKRDAFDAKKENQYKGLTTGSSNSAKLYTFSYNFTLADMDDKAKEIYNKYFSETDGKSYEEVKNILTAASYKCN